MLRLRTLCNELSCRSYINGTAYDPHPGRMIRDSLKQYIPHNKYDDTAHKIIPAYHSIYELTQHLLMNKLNKEARIFI
ncbi:hypothetical protein SAMN04487931_101426 [Desulfobacula phenolica]|uniref:Uncharacterized protein n=1 Tax=Desulfobacula phenolica TaxID=90732 RepID=A0A1H2DPS1_9BACT|nr:hypothetical protein SAMN04487931_101426 [Desulfobacula phenolica]